MIVLEVLIVVAGWLSSLLAPFFLLAFLNKRAENKFHVSSGFNSEENGEWYITQGAPYSVGPYTKEQLLSFINCKKITQENILLYRSSDHEEFIKAGDILTFQNPRPTSEKLKIQKKFNENLVVTLYFIGIFIAVICLN